MCDWVRLPSSTEAPTMDYRVRLPNRPRNYLPALDSIGPVHMSINQNEPPSREECERDEAMQRPFNYAEPVIPEKLMEWKATDPWNTDTAGREATPEHGQIGHEGNPGTC